MRKVIAAINMTLDGYCDHTKGIVDDEIHQHYTELLRHSGAVLYGRITYQLMESFWPNVVKNPTGNKTIDEFAVAMENIPKITFSHTLENVEWASATLAKRSIGEEVIALKQQPGEDILVGSRSLIITLMNMQLIDEFQLCVHPIIAGKGLSLFANINDSIRLHLAKTKTFGSGVVAFYYELNKRNDEN
ncbi:dihydrofolate reductase [Chitinophaga polysaccharea]|uniref:dihydrofolate reductase family protein n=1 Tax=Chitinophaga TaxID=79328 RepID=UPI001455B18C|nr:MULTISPECIES: dihydrofolate reductase family protein [Chitinophaga]NLR58117.1 dihydrofolate reductase [Chitinophaga polysaccharea]NLU90655.1 dihydrofolate reductase [Chitinophaga sp. Ak27]